MAISLVFCGNLPVDEILELFLPLLETGPGNGKGLFAFFGLAADHALHLGVELDDPGQERALVEVVEDRGQQEASHGVPHPVGFRGFKEIANQAAILEKEVVEASATFLGQLISFEGTQDRAEEVRAE